ncbi:hypothetical protein THIOM_005121 [Candidatus Thiomargarita nelsonii]|uniref:Uncharacterized protein n=1 Tax=Candidatus Thiomargarita nelsonii TaxID=1003181 RepID=A0A176RU34_9GAMM|nr:hypothetical protein THIOM_005121 [Candidatus Thiomargarita nelsonii]
MRLKDSRKPTRDEQNSMTRFIYFAPVKKHPMQKRLNLKILVNHGAGQNALMPKLKNLWCRGRMSP